MPPDASNTKAKLLDSALRGAAEDTQVYVCGPDGFMTKVVAIATRYVPAESVHYENFHASEQPDASENAAFDVELDGQTYHVPPNRTIVEVLPSARRRARSQSGSPAR